MRLETHVGKEFSGVFILMIFLLLTFTFVLPSATPGAMFPRTLEHAYSPTTIAAASLPLRPIEPVTDWLDALNWMRVNLQSTDVVAAWWDYGYWITDIANKTTIADNGTVNSTQIAQIGLMFMSTETEAIKILRKYDATHVVVFTTFRLTEGEGGEYTIIDQGWGDEGKWRWMAKIAGGTYNFSDADFVEKDTETGEPKWDTWNDRGKNTVIYKLMAYGKETTVYGASSTIQLEHFEKAYFSRLPGGYSDPLSKYGIVPLVCVYKINYD